MPLTCASVIPPAPSTTRGEPTVISGWMGPPRGDAGPRVVYGNGPNVYLRKLEAPGDVQVIHRNKHPVTVAVASPSGSYCAAGDKDGNVVVFALDNVDNTVKLEKKVVSGQINDVAWSGDNQRLVAVGDGKEGFASAFALDGGNTIGDMIGHSKAVMSCDFRKERPFRIATGGSDSVFNWYEGPPFKFKHAVNQENTVNCARFAPDGSNVVFTSGKKVMIHDGKTGQAAGEFPEEHKGTIYQVNFHKDGKRLLSSSADKSVKLWDVEGKTCTQTFQMQNDKDFMQVGCCFVGDHMCSLGLNGDISILAADGGVQTLRGHQAKVNCLVRGPDGVVASCGSDNAVILWEDNCKNPAGSRRPAAKKPHGSMVTGAVFAGGTLLTGAMNDEIGVTDLGSGAMTLPGKVSGGVFGMAAVGDCVFVATGKGISVLDPAGAEKGQVKTDYTPQCISASAEKGLVAVGAKEKKIIMYAVEGAGLKQVGEVTGLSSAVTCVAFAADGARLAACGQSKELGVYEAPGCEKVECGLDGSFHSSKLTTVSFNPSGTLLLSGSVDAKLIVWDLAAKAKKEDQTGAHHGGVQCSVWATDEVALTGGADGAIRVWALTPAGRAGYSSP